MNNTEPGLLEVLYKCVSRFRFKKRYQEIEQQRRENNTRII